jgi:SNF2-related domain/Helicase conserved C-terminal domain
VQAFLAAIRKACLSGLWSQGVALARDGAVLGADVKDNSVTVRVRQAGRPVAPTVVLYPEDGEWSCDCGGKIDPCAHVAAAAIALAQAGQEGRSLPSAEEASAHLRYRIDRNAGALALGRFVVHPDGREEPVRGSLAGPGPARAAGLAPTHEDLTLDRLVGHKQHGYFPPDRVPEIFAALGGCGDVIFEGRPTKISAEPLLPKASIVDAEGGVALVIEADPSMRELVTGGIALTGDSLRPLGETDLTGSRLEKLPIRRVFARADLGTLVAEVLPGLEKRFPVEVRSKRLPRGGTSRSRPRILLALEQKDHTLSVTPSLVYGDPPEARIDDGRLVHLGGRVPAREEAAERSLLQRLRDELHLVPGRRVDFDGADAVRFAERLKAWDGGGGGEAAHHALFGGRALVPRFAIDDRSFDVVFETVAGEDAAPVQQADALSVIRAWQDGLPLVPLHGGGWAPLPHDWLEKYGERVADLLAARREGDKAVPTAALPALADLCDALEHPRPSGFDRLAPLIEGFESIPDAKLPADLTATLRPYQERGVSWLCFLRDAGLGAVLADDMGLGKTLMTLCVLKGRTLVVCPRSVVHNWADEIRRFRPALRSAIYHGPKRALDPQADVTLTTYAVLRLDAELLAQQAWGTVVLDEAQAIKNPDSQAARAAYELRGDLAVALSGTPVENRLEELWSLFHFTNRGLLGGKGDFLARYARPVAAGDAGAAARLRRKIRPFVLRRMKRDVVPELPPRSDAILYCELEESERAVYEAVRAATRKEVVARLAAGGGASVLAALEALLRLRQAACHPALVPGQDAATSSKIERLCEALEDAAADGHKALVFSQWTSLLDLIEPHLNEAGIAFARLDGTTRDRGAVVGDFQREDGPPVMLISLKAGGTGLNLTAADHVFLMDPWWNPAVEDQAEARAHRIGQDRPVMVYRLVAKDTVEEGILALQAKKRGIAEAALGEADQAAGITREDLLALLA